MDASTKYYYRRGMVSKKYFTSLLGKIITTLLFIGTYHLVYVSYLSTTWGYIGYNLAETSIFKILFTYLIAFIPILFYRGIKELSSFMSLIIYLMAYVPIIMTLLFNSMKIEYWRIVMYQFTFMIAVVLFFSADRFNLKRFGQSQIKLPISALHILTAIITGYLLYVYSGNIRFVGFDDVYDLRFENAHKDSLAGYFEMWANYCIYPFYVALGIYNRKFLYVIIGILGHVLIYSTSGAKASIVMPLVIYAIYFVLKRDKKGTHFYRILTYSLILFSVISLLLQDKLYYLGAVFLMRTLSMPGLLVSQYLTFFSNSPKTYYSHIGFINSITNAYPYGDEPLGRLIGWYFYENSTNASANFWATDGIAAAGLIGVVLISLLLFFFMLLLNKLFKTSNSVFYLLAFISVIFALLNLPFFTTLISGGMILLILLLRYVDFGIDES